MPVNMTKVEAQSDYMTGGKAVNLNTALMKVTDQITYATNGIEPNLANVNAELIATDVHDIILRPDGAILEAGVIDYVGKWDRDTGLLKIFKVEEVDVRDSAGTGVETVTRQAEYANAGTIDTNFQLTILYVTPGSTA